jgi:hypothetical protein
MPDATVQTFIDDFLTSANEASARTVLDVDQAGTDNSTDVTLAGSLDYLTISGQQITRNAIDITTDVTGTLPVANGGTGQTSLASVNAADFGSGAATDGYVLTADGAGGAAWEATGGGGGPGGSTDWGDIGGTLADQTDLQTALDGKAASSHTHTLSDVLGLGDAATLDSSEGGNASADSGKLAKFQANGGLKATGRFDFRSDGVGGTASFFFWDKGNDHYLRLQFNSNPGSNETQQVTDWVFVDKTQTLTNKTIDGGSNTLTNLPAANLTGTLADARVTESNVTQHEAALSIAASQVSALPVEIGVACSDETTALTTGAAKVTFRLPHAMTLTAVRASVTTAPTGSTLVVDINESGSTILSTKLSIDAGEKTSTTAATAAVISDSALADDAEITIDIDQIGATVAGAGLKLWLIGTRA